MIPRLEVNRFLPFQLQDLAAQLNELWNLMDTSEEERSWFDEVTVPRAVDLIEQLSNIQIL